MPPVGPPPEYLLASVGGTSTPLQTRVPATAGSGSGTTGTGSSAGTSTGG